MFSMTKSRELDDVQTPFYFINRRHYGEDVKFYPGMYYGVCMNSKHAISKHSY